MLPWFVAIVDRSPATASSCRVGRPRHARQGVERAGGARRAAGLLISCCSGSRSGRRRVLAGAGGAGGLAARREPGARFLLAWLRAVLDRVRAGDHQAAALRAAALSGDRHPDRRHSRGRRARRKYRWLVRGTVGWFLFPAVICGRRAGRLHRLRPRARPARLAVRGRWR